MKRNFTPENLERFLKETADDLQMQPSVDVWNRISDRMNRRRRWVFFTSAFFLVTASVFGYYIIDGAKTPGNPFASIQTITKKPVSRTNATAPVPKASPLTTRTSVTNPQVASTRNGTTKSNTTKQVNNVPKQRRQVFQNPMPAAPVTTSTMLDSTSTSFSPTVVDEHAPYAATADTSQAVTSVLPSDPMTIESVVNTYQRSAKKRKTEFQVFFTPTVSYRRLTENKSYLRTSAQTSGTLAALYDVNAMVTHKPDMGIELGFAFKYPITNRIKLRSGMQFNINRYDIKAFTYIPERTTITLNTRMQGGIDSVNTISSYRNFSGGRQDWLQNFYFQASTPIGVEVALGNVHKTYFGLATTIQPTYVLGDRAYLISTDYKNYSQVPWLMRRWNVNTSAEAFVSYSTGKLRWQVGPQVRYQLLSSFVSQYPVKENLFDFGMKMGISLDRK